MTDAATETAENPGPKAPKVKKRRKVAKAKTAAKPKPAAPKPDVPDQFAGITMTACPSACTPERCVISTVAQCKHPHKTGDSGCGPITMRNRDAARKIVKRQLIDRI